MDNENARLRAARNAMVRTCTTTGGPSHEGERWVHWADYQALMDAVDAALTPAPEAPKGGEGGAVSLADWSGLPDVYVTSAKLVDGIFWEITACSVPMAIGPEVRLIRADRANPAPGADFKAGMLRAAEIASLNAWAHKGSDDYSQGMDYGARHQVKTICDAIRAEAEKITSSDAGGGAQPDMRALGMEG